MKFTLKCITEKAMSKAGPDQPTRGHVDPNSHGSLVPWGLTLGHRLSHISSEGTVTVVFAALPSDTGPNTGKALHQQRRVSTGNTASTARCVRPLAGEAQAVPGGVSFPCCQVPRVWAAGLGQGPEGTSDEQWEAWQWGRRSLPRDAFAELCFAQSHR